MADRHRRERAVTRWTAAVRGAHKARAAMQLALRAYPGLSRALQAAARRRCWALLRHVCGCRLLLARLLAKARLHPGREPIPKPRPNPEPEPEPKPEPKPNPKQKPKPKPNPHPDPNPPPSS